MPKLINDYDKERWEDDRVKGYHVVYGLCEFLGFDPLFFEALDKNIFPGGYRRHHFRDSKIRKVSSHANDMILTNAKNHNDYEQYNEGFMVAVMNSIKDLMYNNNVYDNSDLTPMIKDLRNALVSRMTSYMQESLGKNSIDPEKDLINPFTKKGKKPYRTGQMNLKQLVGEVWSRWNGLDPQQSVLDPFDTLGSGTGIINSMAVEEPMMERLEEFNDRREDYLKTGLYEEFLKQVYGMDKNNIYVRNAKDLDGWLVSPEFHAGHEKLYTEEGSKLLLRKALGISGAGTPFDGSEINKLYNRLQDLDYLHLRMKRVFQI
ncbi:MAG: hypothetical protein GF311_22865 [Candidatus Lokiarchaeota archaeon]|nr:hypothetical protein [Candidatus Lokiarchaeota archaeon]